MVKVETDPGSGFCGGVIRAITKAEEFLSGGGTLYSLGAIVHNEAELARLQEKGLVTVNSLSEVPEGGTVLIRAHGEPPSTYREAVARGLSVIDCSCPVVLKLQERIRRADGQIIIFGRVGHAEVLGLMGQVEGNALVVENAQMLTDALDSGRIDLKKPVVIFSQTTKSPTEYQQICQMLLDAGANLTINDTICGQVASRHQKLERFAASHDVILFVSGRHSSNGKVLSDLCRSVNPATYHITSEKDIDFSWIAPGQSVGICGATSTPKWLLEQVAEAVSSWGNAQ